MEIIRLYKKCQNERNGIIYRPSEIVDDNLWDLLIKLLDFDPIRRISAEKALQHPFFTSQQALSQITPEAQQIAYKSYTVQQAGDKNITIYDTDSTYIVQTQEIARILKYDPEVEEQNIIAQFKEGKIYNQNKLQTQLQQDNLQQQQYNYQQSQQYDDTQFQQQQDWPQVQQQLQQQQNLPHSNVLINPGIPEVSDDISPPDQYQYNQQNISYIQYQNPLYNQQYTQYQLQANKLSIPQQQLNQTSFTAQQPAFQSVYTQPNLQIGYNFPPNNTFQTNSYYANTLPLKRKVYIPPGLKPVKSEPELQHHQIIQTELDNQFKQNNQLDNQLLENKQQDYQFKQNNYLDNQLNQNNLFSKNISNNIHPIPPPLIQAPPDKQNQPQQNHPLQQNDFSLEYQQGDRIRNNDQKQRGKIPNQDQQLKQKKNENKHQHHKEQQPSTHPHSSSSSSSSSLSSNQQVPHNDSKLQADKELQDSDLIPCEICLKQIPFSQYGLHQQKHLQMGENNANFRNITPELNSNIQFHPVPPSPQPIIDNNNYDNNHNSNPPVHPNSQQQQQQQQQQQEVRTSCCNIL